MTRAERLAAIRSRQPWIAEGSGVRIELAPREDLLWLLSQLERADAVVSAARKLGWQGDADDICAMTMALYDYDADAGGEG